MIFGIESCVARACRRFVALENSLFVCYTIDITKWRAVFLQALDNEFFEAYKRLDSLCSDMFSQQNGVSAYIEEMERQFAAERYCVPEWESTYQKLKHLRWVRNQLAHESGAAQICEKADIESLYEFHSRILSGQDVLVQLRRIKEVQRQQRIKEVQQQRRIKEAQREITWGNGPSARVPDTEISRKEKAGSYAAVVIGMVVFAAVTAALYFFIRFYLT